MGNFKDYETVVLSKYEKVLEELSEDRVFSITHREDGFYIFEKCDEYFCHKLTREECLELSKLFAELAGKMDETRGSFSSKE